MKAHIMIMPAIFANVFSTHFSAIILQESKSLDSIDLMNTIKNLNYDYYKDNKDLVADVLEDIGNDNKINIYKLNVDVETLDAYCLYSFNGKYNEQRLSFEQGYFDQIFKDSCSINNNIKKKNLIAFNMALNNPVTKDCKILKSNSSVSNEELEMLTSSDTFLDGYDIRNRITFDSRGFYIQDEITNLIPLEYFKNPGSYSYFGSEYGFYIKTYNHPTISFQRISDLIVFDIELKDFTHDFWESSLIYSIKVKINSRYVSYYRDGVTDEMRTSFKGNPSNNYSLITSSLDEIPILYLRDFNFAFSLKSLTSLNANDYGYEIDKDYADFFVGYTIKNSYTQINFNTEPTIYKLIDFISTIVPIIVPSTGTLLWKH